jgi:hypothetical protein
MIVVLVDECADENSDLMYFIHMNSRPFIDVFIDILYRLVGAHNYSRLHKVNTLNNAA